MVVPAGVIARSVGFAGANMRPDVLMIQNLLNAVPPPRGGPMPLLSVDGMCGPKTCGAIRGFQMRNASLADGRIDPGQRTEQTLLNMLDSIGQLGQLLGGTTLPIPGTQTPATGTGPASSLREGIKQWALTGANGPYGDIGGGAANGIASDLDTTIEQGNGYNKTVRRGWKNLKEFFDVGVSGWTENHWKAPGYLDGVKIPGKRVPQPGRSGVSWCGIFATWCWIKAGKDSKWVAGLGPTNANKISGNQGIQVGDICVQGGPEVHHFIAIDTSAGLKGVNGNSDYQSILIKDMPITSVQYYYRPD